MPDPVQGLSEADIKRLRDLVELRRIEGWGAKSAHAVDTNAWVDRVLAALPLLAARSEGSRSTEKGG